MSGSELTPEAYRHDLEVVRNTAEQVKRDFGMSGLEIAFSGNHETAYQELFEQVLPALKMLYKTNPGSFMALLYRIDVAETKVKRLSQSVNSEEFITKISELVLEREFMKVLTRKLFSHRKG